MPHKFDPAEAGRLLSEERRRWQPPELVLAALALKPGEVFADIGCGPGYFAFPAAQTVGPRGKIFAVDISLDMLMQLGKRLYAAGLSNVENILSKESNIPLPDGCADAALLANVLHEAEDPVALLAEARRLVRAGGRLLVVDWRPEPTPVGPPVGERLAPEAALAMAQQSGWGSPAPAEAGPYHWGLLFTTS